MRVTFVWNANTEEDIAGYKIYSGSASGTYDDANSPRDVGNVTTGYFDVNTFGSTRYFALTAYNDQDQESDFSTEVSQSFTRPITLFRR